MRRSPKPAKSKPPVTRKSPKDDGARVRDLERRLAEGQEQQAATAEILRVISSSPSDIQFVFDTIVRTAARLCDAFDANLVLADGEEFVQRAHHGPISAPVLDARYPLRGTVGGRAILEARIIQVEDLAAATEYPLGSALAQQIGYRTTLIVPLIRDGLALGAIGIRRTEVKPFTDRQIALLQTFADQAVIAIENVRLFKELEARNSDLTATSTILQVISRSPTDVQPVFDAIARSATTLCEADLSGVYPFDGELIHFGAWHCRTPEEIDAARQAFPQPPSRLSVTARAILAGKYHVDFDDVKMLAGSVLRHRLVLNFHARADGGRRRDHPPADRGRPHGGVTRCSSTRDRSSTPPSSRDSSRSSCAPGRSSRGRCTGCTAARISA